MLHRLQTAVLGLIVADNNHRQSDAETILNAISGLQPTTTREEIEKSKALLIYHTSFGDLDRALSQGSKVVEMERCKEIGLAGVQIGTNVNQKNLGDAEFFDFFKACEDAKMAIFVHPWEMMGEQNMQKYWLPWLVGMPAEVSRAICSLIFSGTLERCPGLRICFAHGGGSFPATLGRIDHGFNVRPDLCAVDNPHSPRRYLSRMYFDSLVHEPAKLDFLIKLVGADQIMLGSDYPFPLGEAEPGKMIESLNYDESITEMLFNGAALNWLNLKWSEN